MAIPIHATTMTSRNDRLVRPSLLMLVIGICAALLCEVFIFNLPYWQTRSSHEDTISAPTLGAGISREKKGELRITANHDDYVEVLSNNASEGIEYLRLNEQTGNHSAYLSTYDIVTKQPHDLGWYSGGTQRYISSADSRSRLIHVDGHAQGARVEFRDGVGTTIPVGSITINPHISFAVSAWRLSVETLLALAIAFFRPGSFLYRIPLRRSAGQRVVLLTAVLIQLAILFGIWELIGGPNVFRGTSYNGGSHWGDFEQYARLSDALIHGHTNLDLPVPSALKQLGNPYDPDVRNALSDGGKIPMFWDHAYFHGKYYSYFGVIPAIILYVPYQLLTHQWLPTSVAVLIFSLVAVSCMSWLVVMIARKMFPQTASLGTTLLLMIAATLGSSIIYQLSTPNFYSIPGVASLAFTSAGLACWLAAKRQGGDINPWLIALGSVSIAANLGCRPQFTIAVFLALPLFWDEIVRTRAFFSIRGLGNTIAALTPFLLVATGMGWYNAIRFGSPLDLGSNYNLTGFDMTNAHLPARNALLVMWYGLFQPSNVTLQFPFIGITPMPLPAWSPAEFSVGGLFAIAPFLFLALISPWLPLRSKGLVRGLACSAAGFGAFILMFDASLTGFAWRYYLDFAWLFVLAAVVVTFAGDHVTQTLIGAPNNGTEPEINTDGRSISIGIDLKPNPYMLTKALRLFVLIAVISSALFQFFALFIDQRYIPLIARNPRYYFTVAHWFLVI